MYWKTAKVRALAEQWAEWRLALRDDLAGE
jgi:hypothetical protein